MKGCIIVVSFLFVFSLRALSQNNNGPKYYNIGYASSIRPEFQDKPAFYINKEPTDFNKKPFHIPMLEILGVNILVNRFDVFVLNADWAKVSPASWKNNLTQGFKSDGDNFSTNFFGHSVHGSLYYNSARSSGRSFWQSAAYAAGGVYYGSFLGRHFRLVKLI